MIFSLIPLFISLYHLWYSTEHIQNLPSLCVRVHDSPKKETLHTILYKLFCIKCILILYKFNMLGSPITKVDDQGSLQARFKAHECIPG